MAEPKDIGWPQHDQLEGEGGGIGLQDQLLGRLVVAVTASLSARKILRQRTIALAPAVIDRQAAEMDEAAHAAKPYRLGDIARAAEIDVEGEAERLLHPGADQARGMHTGIDPMRLDGLYQRREIAHV